MGTVRQLLLAAVLVSATQLGTLSHAVADDDDAAERASRWQALQQALFPGHSLKDGAGIIQLDAPPRALLSRKAARRADKKLSRPGEPRRAHVSGAFTDYGN